MNKKLMMIILFFLMLSACADEKNFENPLASGALNEVSYTFVLYNDKLNTGGGIVLDKGWENQEFADVYSDPYKGNRCFRYSWNGMKVQDNNWCQLYFLVGKDWLANKPKNLVSGRYNKLELYARGELTAGTILKFCGPNGENSGDLTSLSVDWKKYSIPLDTAKLTNVWNYFSIFFYSDHGTGGTVYIDDVKLTR